jgi:hypothetical protein
LGGFLAALSNQAQPEIVFFCKLFFVVFLLLTAEDIEGFEIGSGRGIDIDNLGFRSFLALFVVGVVEVEGGIIGGAL